MVRYCSTAGALGAGWFVVLMVPGITRGWLLAHPWLNLLHLVAASIAVSVLCRRSIARAVTLADHLVRAVVVPYLGCFVFLSLWAATLWAQSLVRGGLFNLHETLSLYAMGMAAAVLSCLVVIPYALLCQYFMNKAAWSTSS